MVTLCSILLIITVVTVALTQTYFPARFGQGGKLASPEFILFRAGSAVYLPFDLSEGKFRWRRLLFLIRAVGLPIRTRLRIAAGWGIGCIAAHATRCEPVTFFRWIRKKIRACACDISSSRGIANGLQPATNVLLARISVDFIIVFENRCLSWRYRAPIKKSEERMCGGHLFLADSQII